MIGENQVRCHALTALRYDMSDRRSLLQPCNWRVF